MTDSSSSHPHEEEDEVASLPWFVALSQVVGIAMVVLVGVWAASYLGGFAWDGSGLQFNVHPLCMVVGLIFLYGEAAIVYRVFRQTEKFKAKIIHSSLHLLALVSMVIGLVAVFQFHNAQNIANLYSLHSWCGMATVVLFCMQFCLGFLGFLFPGTNGSLRKKSLPYHQFFGSGILVMACASAISGIDEKLLFVNNGSKDKYTSLAPVYTIGNILGLVIVTFILLILWILFRSEWKRKPLPEEREITVHFQRITNEDDSASNCDSD